MHMITVSGWIRPAVLALSLVAVATGPALAAGDVAGPLIVARAEWKAAPANIALMRPQTAKGIIVHHTGEKQNWKSTLEKKLRGLQGFSMRPGTVGGTGKAKPAWGDMPYHFYIDATGRIGEGRDVAYAGDTNTGYVTDGYIQLVLEGEFGKETPDPRQLDALDKLTIMLAGKYRIAATSISGHNDHAKSECPGKNFKPYLDELRTKVAATQVR